MPPRASYLIALVLYALLCGVACGALVALVILKQKGCL